MLIITLFLVGCGGPATTRGGNFRTSDNDMQLGDWSFSGADVEFEHVSGGADGYLRITMNLPGGGEPVRAVGIRTEKAYIPEASLGTLTFTEKYSRTDPEPAMMDGPACRQGGTVFFAPPQELQVSSDDFLAIGDLTGADFVADDGSTPDLDGGPIEFGFYRTAQSESPATVESTIDDWGVDIVVE